MNGQIRKKALEFLSEEKIIEFLKLFFNVHVKENTIYLDTWTENGSLVYITLFVESWKEDFEKYIKKFSDNLNESIGDSTTLTSVQEDNVRFREWLADIYNLTLVDVSQEVKEEETPKEESDIYVVTFDKGHYKRNDLEKMSDMEKYKAASRDEKRCHVHTKLEYEEIINSFKPIEKYVWTYIIRITDGEQGQKGNNVLD